MAEAGLLVLLHGAVDRNAAMTGELRTWSHAARSQEAFEVAAAAMAIGGTMHLIGAPDGAEESESRWRVVHAAGGRYRLDQVAQSGRSTGVVHPAAQGCDGERSWYRTAEEVFLGRSRVNMLMRLLDPSWVLTHDLAVVDRGESSGRPVLHVRATARPSRPRGGGAADVAAERDIVVDAERGFLHADTALVHAEPYDLMELREVIVDPDVDPDVFAPDIPDGMKVNDHTGDVTGRPWEHRRRWHVQWPVTRW